MEISEILKYGDRPVPLTVEVAEEVWHNILPRIARDDTDALENRAEWERRLLEKADEDEEKETLCDGRTE